MLEKNIADGKSGPTISDDELDAIRGIEPQTQSQISYDVERYERLNYRLADELARDNNISNRLIFGKFLKQYQAITACLRVPA